MAPNPSALPRKPNAKMTSKETTHPRQPNWILLSSACLAFVAIIFTTHWARRWLSSGCALESLLLVLGDGLTTRIFPTVPLWTLLATLNLLYAVCSTSWLLYTFFAMGCYPLILFTCLFQFALVADAARKNLRKLLKGLHFTKDKIALFNLPALEIDTEVDGLMVIRGITVSLSNLTVIAHGIELGLKLADEIELSMYADEVRISLFRRIDIGDVFGNIKGGKLEMSFAELEEPDDGSDNDSIFLDDTPLLRAATAGSTGFANRSGSHGSSLRESLPGLSWMKDSSVEGAIDSVTTLSPDDELAEKQYVEMLNDIRTNSPIYQSRQQVREKAQEEPDFVLANEKDMRAAMCAQLHKLPSIIHPPSRSVRVTTLQHLSRPSVRRFLHRLPLLLRLLLAPIGYFHPVNINSINAAGSGQWLTSFLHEKVFKHYGDKNAELRKLIRRVSAWLADANFCMQLTNIDGMGQVPISSNFDIVSYLRFADIMAYRTAITPVDQNKDLPDDDQSVRSVSVATEPIPAPKKSKRRSKMEQVKPIAQVLRLGGADATVSIPSYLLPHHEHMLPPKPSLEDEEEQSREVEKADGKPKTMQAEKKLEQVQKDETNMNISVHARLPACFDQSVLNFAAALVKATKIIELEKAAHDAETTNNVSDGGPLSPVSTAADDDTSSIASEDMSMSRTGSGFKAFTKNLRQGMKDGSTRETIREFAKDMHQTTKNNFQKAVVGGMVNDRWIAKMVGKVAAKLEEAQGDLGYSGDIPLPLEPYRLNAEEASKLLP